VFVVVDFVQSLYTVVYSFIIVSQWMKFMQQKSRSTLNIDTPVPHNATPYKRPAAGAKAVALSSRRRLSSAYWHETVDGIGVSRLDKTQLDRQEVRLW